MAIDIENWWQDHNEQLIDRTDMLGRVDALYFAADEDPATDAGTPTRIIMSERKTDHELDRNEVAGRTAEALIPRTGAHAITLSWGDARDYGLLTIDQERDGTTECWAITMLLGRVPYGYKVSLRHRNIRALGTTADKF